MTDASVDDAATAERRAAGRGRPLNVIITGASAGVGRALAPPLPPVDPMPWWTMRFKERAYRFWDAPFHSEMAFNFNFYVFSTRVLDAVLHQVVEKRIESWTGLDL